MSLFFSLSRQIKNQPLKVCTIKNQIVIIHWNLFFGRAHLPIGHQNMVNTFNFRCLYLARRRRKKVLTFEYGRDKCANLFTIHIIKCAKFEIFWCVTNCRCCGCLLLSSSLNFLFIYFLSFLFMSVRRLNVTYYVQHPTYVMTLKIRTIKLIRCVWLFLCSIN